MDDIWAPCSKGARFRSPRTRPPQAHVKSAPVSPVVVVIIVAKQQRHFNEADRLEGFDEATTSMVRRDQPFKPLSLLKCNAIAQCRSCCFIKKYFCLVIFETSTSFTFTGFPSSNYCSRPIKECLIMGLAGSVDVGVWHDARQAIKPINYVGAPTAEPSRDKGPT